MNHYKLLLCVHFNIYLEPFKIATEKRALRQPLMMYSVVTNEYKLHHIYIAKHLTAASQAAAETLCHRLTHGTSQRIPVDIQQVAWMFRVCA